ncbi:MAG: TraR/DksA C4-type zinc finger protein [Coriobacteriia bacterium]|nr:TraR/DksA C4-type zinc finger protein [Coriobacteriia bacterium]
MEATDIKALRSALEAERAKLAAEIEEYEREGHETLSDVSGENNYRDHMADQGSATFARELDATLEGQARESLAQIDRALSRISDGKYGTCIRCGSEIAAERLEVMPEAELCLACKEREENI